MSDFKIPLEAFRCPTCSKQMPYYGGTAGYVCCDWKILRRERGWFAGGVHVRDPRLAGGPRRSDGIREIRV